MIGGIIMIFVVLWFWQSASKAKMENVLMWVAIGGLGFLALEFVLEMIDIYILESLRASKGGAAYEALNGADRRTQDGFFGFAGNLNAIFQELFPPFASFVAMAFVRLKFITKESLSAANLFSGIKEMFQSIKQSFKTPE